MSRCVSVRAILFSLVLMLGLCTAIPMSTGMMQKDTNAGISKAFMVEQVSAKTDIPKTITVPAKGGTYYITLKAPVKKVVSNCNWIKITKYNKSNKIKIVVMPNKTGKKRCGTITVIDIKGHKSIIRVVQLGR